MDILIGAIVSVIVEIIKKLTGTKEWVTLLFVLLTSIVAAGIYAFLIQTTLWDKILPVLGYAGAIYVYIIRRFEK